MVRREILEELAMLQTATVFLALSAPQVGASLLAR
jgi:hypothetical protein